MAILILFAFLGGIITILSPCILPVLPVVLSGGMGREKFRPLGIISGFITSFTLFTLALTTIVRATGISTDALRYLAIGIILFFGLVLTVPGLHRRYSVITAEIFHRLNWKNFSVKHNHHPDTSRLYQLVGLDAAGPHVLSLDVKGNIRLFAFTFG